LNWVLYLGGGGWETKGKIAPGESQGEGQIRLGGGGEISSYRDHTRRRGKKKKKSPPKKGEKESLDGFHFGVRKEYIARCLRIHVDKEKGD